MFQHRPVCQINDLNERKRGAISTLDGNVPMYDADLLVIMHLTKHWGYATVEAWHDMDSP